jgi:hypothetical protein
MRYKSKTPPTKGTVISSIWKYTIVSIRRHQNGNGQDTDLFNIFEMSKHKKFEEAIKYLDDRRATFYRRCPEGPHEYFLAEWKEINGECVLVLMDDPALDSLNKV